jgi:hypothetical protein
MMTERNFPFALKKTQIDAELHRMHLRSISAIRKPLLSKKNKEYRRYFVEAIRTDFRMLLPWLFTDEASITLNWQRFSVWRVPGMIDNHDIYTEQTQFPIRIMVWGAVAKNFKSQLIRVVGTLNAEGYIKLVMESGVIPSMNEKYGRKAWVFQDDGASPHRAKKTRASLAEHCFALSTELHWPAHSPDLNVIENVWAFLKDRMTVSNCENADQLWAEAQAAWDSITIEDVNRIVDSFHDRLLSVSALDGQALNGHRAVQKMVRAGHTVDEIRTMRYNEDHLISIFLRESQRLFEDEPWTPDQMDQYMTESRRIVQILPEGMQKKLRPMILGLEEETREGEI